MTEIPWTWLAIRASGITAWGLLTAVVLWGILLRTRLLGRLASPMRLLDLHRWLGATALAFLLIHMILLLVDPAVKFTVAQLLIPGPMAATRRVPRNHRLLASHTRLDHGPFASPPGEGWQHLVQAEPPHRLRGLALRDRPLRARRNRCAF